MIRYVFSIYGYFHGHKSMVFGAIGIVFTTLLLLAILVGIAGLIAKLPFFLGMAVYLSVCIYIAYRMIKSDREFEEKWAKLYEDDEEDS